MKRVRVVFKNDKYYPQVKSWFVWQNIWDNGRIVYYDDEENAINRAKTEARGESPQIVWDNDDYE